MKIISACRVPACYPSEPPRVCSVSCYRLGEKVRFNPNLYDDGKVCLSIIKVSFAEIFFVQGQ